MVDEYGRIPRNLSQGPAVSLTNFTVVRRGFDPQEVRDLLESLERQLEAARQREAELHQTIERLRHQANNPVIDEQMITAALGERSAEILRSSHEEARSLLEQVRARAAELMAEAQERAEQISVDAEQRAAERLGDAELGATQLEAKALDAARRTVLQARADGATLVDRAREQGRAMIDQAQEARDRVLSDMNGRRRAMHVQLEQLRAARDHLAGTIVEVRGTIDRLTGDIADSDDAAKAAAEEVARRQPTLPEVDLAPFEAVLEEPARLEEPASHPRAVSTPVPQVGEDDGVAPEPGVVEELFKKIRASAHDEPTGGVPVVHVATAPEGAPEHDVQDLHARDAALSAARSTLARKVKRVLQDQQNHLLDAVRAVKASSPDLLDPEVDLIAALAAASVDPLRDAANAGRTYATDHGVSGGGSISDVVLMRIADSLAAAVIMPLRRRLESVLATEDPSAEVGAAYREWRGSRLDRAVGDAALEAFSAAVVAQSQQTSVRWVVAGAPSPCPDCADNGLAGALEAGAGFPTGQAHPPAHPGCRCAVVPVLS